MHVHDVHCLVHVTQNDLWDYLADYDALLRLTTSDPRTCGCRLVGGRPGVAGATYAAWVQGPGPEVNYAAVLREAVRAERLVWSGLGVSTHWLLEFFLERMTQDTTALSAALFLSPHLKRAGAWEPVVSSAYDPKLEHLIKKLQLL